MPSVFEKLRLAREARGISLEDIVTATRIPLRILKTLEEGTISALPETYVRAFLRAYAKEVGLNDTEILHDYEQENRDTRKPDERDISATSLRPGSHKRAIRVSQSTMLAIVAAVLVLSFVGFVFFFGSDEQLKEIQEIPFTDAVKQERPASPFVSDAPSVLPEKTPELPEPSSAGKPPAQASLVLRAMTFDSAWIQIVIDGKIRREYHVPPRWSSQWKAADRFSISVNNASSVSFVLNNAPLGIIGQPGKAVRNYVIERSALPSQQTDAGGQ